MIIDTKLERLSSFRALTELRERFSIPLALPILVHNAWKLSGEKKFIERSRAFKLLKETI